MKKREITLGRSNEKLSVDVDLSNLIIESKKYLVTKVLLNLMKMEIFLFIIILIDQSTSMVIFTKSKVPEF